MKELKTIEETACRLLREGSDPVVRFRFLRDVLRVPPDSESLVNARREMLQSLWISQLKCEQREDGGWGRFHSAMKAEGRIGTTEVAVARAL